MPGKPITPQAIEQDLRYVLNGTAVSQLLARMVFKRTGSILEAGCGSGKFALGLWRAGYAVTAFDIDPGVMDYAWALRDELLKVWQPPKDWPMLHEEIGSIFALSQDYPNTFDLVFNEGVPHHFPKSDPRRQECFNQMAAATKPGGTVCVVGSYASERMLRYAQEVAQTYLGMPEHQEPFTRDELRECFAKAGLVDFSYRTLILSNNTGSEEEPDGIIGWGRKP